MGHSLVVCEDDAINTLIGSFYREKVGAYWDKERKYIDEHYTTVPFPYEPLPSKEISDKCSVEPSKHLVGYFNTRSSVQHFIKAKEYNPVNELAVEIEKSMGE